MKNPVPKEKIESASPSMSAAAASLESTSKAILAFGKGILAADESFPTITKRFQALNIPSTEATRRDYREMLCTTPGLSEFISGVILFEETLRQRTKDGIPIPEVLWEQGIIPGIKVDKGTIALPGFPGERITQGFDGLRERLVEYRELGARFTKWRGVIAVSGQIPTLTCIADNANALALFAALSQEAGLVPIVEPEVLMNGTHSIGRCEEVTTETLHCVFEALSEHRVVLEHTLLKTGMVLAGSECAEQPSIEAVAEATLRSLRRTVPSAVPGIVFLSGGQSDEIATQRLNALCHENDGPWTLSFSFGRALQAPALNTWKGSPENVSASQAALYHRARCNSFAVKGEYSPELEKMSEHVTA
jgi:fructose-bisphosphate aldolase class I